MPESGPCPLIAACFCERVGESRGAQRPRSGAVGALGAAARERIMRGGRGGGSGGGAAWGRRGAFRVGGRRGGAGGGGGGRQPSPGPPGVGGGARGQGVVL